jgi:hypothetical protein
VIATWMSGVSFRVGFLVVLVWLLNVLRGHGCIICANVTPIFFTLSIFFVSLSVILHVSDDIHA